MVGGSSDVLRRRTYVLLPAVNRVRVRVGFCSRLSHLFLPSTATLCVCTTVLLRLVSVSFHFTRGTYKTYDMFPYTVMYDFSSLRRTNGSKLPYVHIGSIKLVMEFDGDSPYYYCCCTCTYMWENARGVESYLGEFCAKDTTYCCTSRCRIVDAHLRCAPESMQSVYFDTFSIRHIPSSHVGVAPFPRSSALISIICTYIKNPLVSYHVCAAVFLCSAVVSYVPVSISAPALGYSSRWNSFRCSKA